MVRALLSPPGYAPFNIMHCLPLVGVYATAPFWGKLVDARGPRILLALGFVTLIAGYSGIRYFYDRGLPAGVSNLSVWAFGSLIFCAFITGLGGNGGLVSALNATAKSFPDRAVRLLFRSLGWLSNHDVFIMNPYSVPPQLDW